MESQLPKTGSCQGPATLRIDQLIHLKPLGVIVCDPEVHKAHVYIKHLNAHVTVGTENKGTVA